MEPNIKMLEILEIAGSQYEIEEQNEEDKELDEETDMNLIRIVLRAWSQIYASLISRSDVCP